MTKGPQRAPFDAAVIGAGPAGSATARWLALQGWRVALLERTRFEKPRIGESLPPNIQEPLRELGLWPDFLGLAALASWGTCSVWGDQAQQSHSHLLNPYGCGWHVDRQAFDHMLARGAVSAGASLFDGVTLQRSVHREGFWRLQTSSSTMKSEAPDRTLRARVLIDATGRRAQVACTLGAQRILFDRLVGVAVLWSGVDVAQQGHLLVEAVREGWWYSAPLPSRTPHHPDAMIAMLMTDADLCGLLRITAADVWHAVLESSRATRQRLGSAHCISKPQAHCAHSQRLRRDCAGNPGPWLAVGDASLAVDPISGSGVLRALRTAHAAALAVGEALARPSACNGALTAYEAERDRECTNYLLERARYYAAEQRFDTPFWQRRRQRLAAASGGMLVAAA